MELTPYCCIYCIKTPHVYFFSFIHLALFKAIYSLVYYLHQVGENKGRHHCKEHYQHHVLNVVTLVHSPNHPTT